MTKIAKRATKQASNPHAGNGGVVPPKERQFGQPNGNPRHNGAWKKEDTARYKLEQMLKLTSKELEAVFNDEDAPLFERKLAACIHKGKWKEIESMINQVYGYPKQAVAAEVTDVKPLIDLRDRKKNGDHDGAGKN